jgi:hypothetical protein
MISQNRADEKRQVLADHQSQTVQEEEQQNQQLLQLSNQILELTKAIHALDTARSSRPGQPAGHLAAPAAAQLMTDLQRRPSGSAITAPNHTARKGP